jgi:hypothetical protein
MNFGISSSPACATTPWCLTPAAMPSSRFASTGDHAHVEPLGKLAQAPSRGHPSARPSM